MTTMEPTYAGLRRDTHGLTQLGRMVLDAWLFELLPESEDCAGWPLARMQALMEQVNARWDAYAGLPSRLPPALRERHARLYTEAIERARSKGWDPELGEDD